MATFQAPDGLGNLVTVTATVPNGGDTSNAVDCQRGQLIGIITPPAVDGDDPVTLVLLGSPDGVAFYPIIADSYGQNPAQALQYAYQADVFQEVLAFAGYATPRWLQIQIQSGGTPFAQSGNRLFTLILLPQ